MKLPLIKCPKCEGKGSIQDRTRIGPTLRSERIQAGVSSLAVSRILKIDKSSLHNMEKGRQDARFTEGTITDYRNAVRKLKAEKERKKR